MGAEAGCKFKLALAVQCVERKVYEEDRARTLMSWPVPPENNKSNLPSEDNKDSFSPGVMNLLRDNDGEVLQQCSPPKPPFSPQTSYPPHIFLLFQNWVPSYLSQMFIDL